MEQYIAAIEDEIADQYLNDYSSRPWIVAFSGGKDSTTLLELVWSSLKRLPSERRFRPLHVVCNNTLVENPIIIAYVIKQIELIRTSAVEQSMPITIEHTVPSLNNTFWVNLIGRGYVAPNSLFRWCTERLKIKPTTKYILEQTSRYGEAIILLGTRKAESSSRAKSIRKYEIAGERLNKHEIPGVYVFAPIKNLTTEQVWWYLAQNESPWHGDNTELVHLYRNASDNNDCPLITDTSTPACGGSRFGCWVCTVVTSDKSMQGLIQTGEKWMLPLLEMRNFLAHTIDREDPDYNAEYYRMPVRRNLERGLGPYWPKWRQEILRRLLSAQAIIQKSRPEISLISDQELVIIQSIWHRDFIYDCSVSDSVRAVYGRSGDQFVDRFERENQLLREACSAHEVDIELIGNLLKAQQDKVILASNRGLQKDIERVLDEHLFPKYTNVYKHDNNK